MLHSTVGSRTLLPTTGFLVSQPIQVDYRKTIQSLGIGQIVVFRGHCMLKDMLEVALLSTVRAEALPLPAPPTLLGIVLPECVSFG